MSNNPAFITTKQNSLTSYTTTVDDSFRENLNVRKQALFQSLLEILCFCNFVSIVVRFRLFYLL